MTASPMVSGEPAKGVTGPPWFPGGSHWPPQLSVGYCGSWHTVEATDGFDIGADGELAVDRTQFLERRLLRLSYARGLWWLANIGTSTGAALCDRTGGAQSWLPPGARVPIVNPRSTVVFTAGPTTYELDLRLEEAEITELRPGMQAMRPHPQVSFTTLQKMVIVALAEPLLRREGATLSDIPASTKAADRLGWRLSTFNRKLDNICDKLDRVGVPGLRGGRSSHAANRRGRLVEYALSARIITPEDLHLLDDAQSPDDAEVDETA